ncbi:MAG TPA: LptF/LptG family permease, partial [Candidatus Deferrimicrobium sp.]|nr:LptF/LptG family permease [Candidatus Deferrimicrobium sp.]
MTVLSRYLFREFLRAAAICILGFLLIFLLIDFVDHAEELLRHNAGPREIGWYYLTRVPGMFVLISPVGTMLAVLVAVSLRVRSNEFTAIFSGGVS